MRLEDLIVLRFTHNDAYVEVVTVHEAEVRVDLSTRRWYFRVGDSPVQVYKIGEANVGARGTTRHRYVIGVFDKTRLSHMNAMVRAAIEAVER